MQKEVSAESYSARVQPEILVLSALLIPVLVTAFVLLYVFPQELGAEHFAWPINPIMSSMMLGATYLGGAYFFTVVLLSRKWEHVRLGFLPISVFAGTLGLATILHWDRFAHERLVFQIWTFLYFVVPVILPVLWYRNQRLAHRAREDGERALPPLSRWGFGVLGAILIIAGLLLFLVPEVMIAAWPWTLSPLTARVMSAIYLLPGLVGLSMVFDNTWSSARHLLQAQAFTIVLMLIAMVLTRADFDWTSPASWFFVGGLSAVLLLIVYTYAAVRE